MTPSQFMSAALELQQRGIIRNGHGWKADLAILTGWSRSRIDRYERDGTQDRTTDLAVSALIAGLPPYPVTPTNQ